MEVLRGPRQPLSRPRPHLKGEGGCGPPRAPTHYETDAVTFPDGEWFRWKAVGCFPREAKEHWPSSPPHLSSGTSWWFSAFGYIELTDTMTRPTSCLLESNTSHQCRRRGLAVHPPSPCLPGAVLPLPFRQHWARRGLAGPHSPSTPALPAPRCPPSAPPAAPRLFCRHPSPPAPMSHRFLSIFCPHEHRAPLAPARLSQTNWLPDKLLLLSPWNCILRNPSPWPSASCRLCDPAASRAPSSLGPPPQ